MPEAQRSTSLSLPAPGSIRCNSLQSCKWVGGTGAIQRTMHGLFGDVPEPWTSCAEDAPVTEPHSVVSLPRVAEPTRPARRLARGTESGCFGDDLDERTRGRAPLRRSRPWLAA